MLWHYGMEYTDTLLLQFSFLIMASFTNTKLDAAAPMVVAMTRTRARLSRDRVLIHSSYSTGFNCMLTVPATRMSRRFQSILSYTSSSSS